MRCLTDRMLTYALGRGLEEYDECTIERIAQGVAKNEYKFSSLVIEIVKSDAFQKKRGAAKLDRTLRCRCGTGTRSRACYIQRT